MRGRRFFRRIGWLAGGALLLAGGCASEENVVGEFPKRRTGDSTPYDYQKKPDDSLFGAGGLFFGTGKKKPGEEEGTGTGIAVNGFLWRASLDTIAFMPVNSADPFGGVIITDWYAMPGAPDERFKMNIYILGRSLRADGVRVNVFRQVRGNNGEWLDAAVEPGANTKIEDAILMRARQLRFDVLSQQ
jgi:hypothetical protein